MTRISTHIKGLWNDNVKFLSRVDVFFYSIAWLIVLVFLGTVAQKDIGLYAAQREYFSSMIIWFWGFVPLPGGMMVMIMVFLGLCAKLLRQKWSMAKFGTLVIHIGAILLLFGGFLTQKYSTEGQMTIKEGAEISYVTDYYAMELSVTEVNDDNTGQVTSFDMGWLKSGEMLQHENIPFQIQVVEFYKNSQISKYISPFKLGNDEEIYGIARYLSFAFLKSEKDPEINKAAISLNISGLDEYDGRYASVENLPIIHLKKEGKTYLIELRHKRTYLPFSIQLIDFQKEVHPGTAKARKYSSDVVLTDKEAKWRSVISMNDPLRYKGYTFFQSSFITENGEEKTVLAVVDNVGRLFPYISSIIMCIGMLIHLIRRLPMMMRKD